MLPDIRVAAAEGKGVRGIFHQGADDGLGEIDLGAVPGLQQDAQGLGVALEVLQVGGHLRGQPGPQRPALIVNQVQMLLEPVSNDHLAKVPEGRVAQIVEQTGAEQNGGDALGGVPVDVRGLVRGGVFGNHDAQLPGHRGDLDGMGEPGPHEIALVQGEDLGFVLKPAESGAGHNFVIVLFKFVDGILGELSGFRLFRARFLR